MIDRCDRVLSGHVGMKCNIGVAELIKENCTDGTTRTERGWKEQEEGVKEHLTRCPF